MRLIAQSRAAVVPVCTPHFRTLLQVAAGVLLIVCCASHWAVADETISLEDRIAVCSGCHGVDGVPINTDTPILAGQEYYYLYVQLKDYQAGRRANAIMDAMVEGLSKDDMKALAEHYSSMEWPRIDSGADGALAGKGESSLNAGQCSQCHSTYQGDSRIPRLAGQHLPYLQQTMSDFKHKVRLNSPAKGSLMDSFGDDQIEGMAHHLSGL